MRSPVFIIAPERSGSTLLRLVLSAHPQLCFPPEGSVALALRNFANQRDLAGQETELAQVLFAREPKMKDWGLTAAEVAARWRNKRPLTPQALVDEVYLAYRDRAAPEALFYGDKNPIHVFHLPLIRQLHPSVRFIYLLRDPRATYASAKRRAGSWKGFSRSLTAAAVMWRQAAIHTSRASNADNGFAMRYEEFVTDPEDQLRRLCDWIGVPYESQLLDPRRRKVSSFPLRRPLYERTPLNAAEVSPARLEAWRQELSSAEVAALELILGGMMRCMKYKPEASRAATFKGLTLLARELVGSPMRIQFWHALRSFLPWREMSGGWRFLAKAPSSPS